MPGSPESGIPFGFLHYDPFTLLGDIAYPTKLHRHHKSWHPYQVRRGPRDPQLHAGKTADGLGHGNRDIRATGGGSLRLRNADAVPEVNQEHTEAL